MLLSFYLQTRSSFPILRPIHDPLPWTHHWFQLMSFFPFLYHRTCRFEEWSTFAYSFKNTSWNLTTGQGLGVQSDMASVSESLWFYYTEIQMHLWVQNVNCHEVKTPEATAVSNGLNLDQSAIPHNFSRRSPRRWGVPRGTPPVVSHSSPGGVSQEKWRVSCDLKAEQELGG